MPGYVTGIYAAIRHSVHTTIEYRYRRGNHDLVKGEADGPRSVAMGLESVPSALSPPEQALLPITVYCSLVAIFS